MAIEIGGITMGNRVTSIHWIFLAAVLIGGCNPVSEAEPGNLDGRVDGIEGQVHADIGSVVVVRWQQLTAAPGWVEYSFEDRSWLSSPRQELGEGEHEQLLLGIPFGVDVSICLVNEVDGAEVASDEMTVTTDNPPSSVPAPEVLATDPGRWDPDRPYLLAGLDDATVILDRQGRVVWMLKTPLLRVTMQPQVSGDGNDILIDRSSFWAIFDGGNASEIDRIKIDGSVVQTYDTPGLHHPFTELADGTIVWAAMDGDDETLEQIAPDGQQRRISTCSELLGGYGSEGYCASNTIRWHEPTDSLLYSLYSHETVIEVDRTTGAALRVFGHHEDAWDFDPAASAFWWQHGANYTAAGTLLTSSYRADEDDELVVREYTLDDETRTLHEVWTFGDGQGIRAEYMGEAHRLPGGNTLHNYGSNPRVREVAPDGTVVWDLAWDTDSFELGRTTPIADLYAFVP
jgi:hypothetical protein